MEGRPIKEIIHNQYSIIIYKDGHDFLMKVVDLERARVFGPVQIYQDMEETYIRQQLEGQFAFVGSGDDYASISIPSMRTPTRLPLNNDSLLEVILAMQRKIEK